MMKITKMRNLLLILAILQVVYFFRPCMSEEEETCKSCADAVTDVLSTATTIIKSSGFDPYPHPDMDPCSKVLIANIASLFRSGDVKETCSMRCKEKEHEGCFIQRLRLGFVKLNVTCFVPDLITLAKNMFKKDGKTFPAWADIKLPEVKLPSWPWGQSNTGTTTTPAPKFTELYAEWGAAEVAMEMLMCYDDDKYEIRKFEFIDKGMKCWCGGGTLLGQIGGLLTGLDAMKKAIGLVASLLIKAVMPMVVGKLPSDMFSMLNCGDKR